MKILKKQPDRDFVILNLSDPQLFDAEWEEGHFANRLLTRTLKELIETFHPDLITVSGDLAYGGQFESYRKLTALLDSFGLPWAPVLGNHDQDASPEDIVKAIDIFCQSPNCLFTLGDPAYGYGNYTIGIEENGRLIHALILMDSHNVKSRIGENGQPYAAWAELWPNQFDWYRDTVASLCKDGMIETTMILHIPFYAYRDAISAALVEGIEPTSLLPETSGVGASCWKEGYKDSFGLFYEGVCCYPEDNGFFEVIKEMKSTKNVVCGHDHVNSISVNYEGVRLTYGLHTGCGCYANPILNGGTALFVSSDGSVRTEHHYIPVKEEQA